MRLAADALRARGFTDVVVTREPGGTPVGEHIRQILLHGGSVGARAEALLYAADRAQHVEEVIRPALARGGIVLTDRFADSSIAYQGDGRLLPEAEIRAITEVATGGLVPDLTIVLDVAPSVGAGRRTGRADRIEAEGEAFHDRVRHRFLAMAARHPERYLVIDASRPQLQIHGEVLAGVLAAIGGRVEVGQ
jgi:dTMP kinase